MDWNIHNNYIVGKYLSKNIKLKNNSKVASFDLDYTIIKPTNGNKFSKTSDDWEFYDISVVPKIRKYIKNNYNLVIVSNQKGISIGKTDQNIWMKKIENMGKKLRVPFIILASLKNDLYRKPRTCLWDEFIKCDKSKSFYCGDAGGLNKRKINDINIPKDFSDSDLKFALNLGINFIHRDEFIFGFKHKKFTPKYGIDFNKITDGIYKFEPNTPEMIINVGYPGSSKSFYTRNYILEYDYVYINRDTLKTAKKCLQACDDALNNEKSVVIDNTNPSNGTRKEYIDLAKKYNIKVRCLNFTTSRELSIHNNIYRHIISKGNTKIVPNIAYNIFRKQYVKPTKEEGFYKIENIDFLLDKNNIDSRYFTFLE